MLVVQAQRRIHAPKAMVSDYLAMLERFSAYDERAKALDAEIGRVRMAGLPGLFPYEGEFRLVRLPGRGLERRMEAGLLAHARAELTVDERDGFTRLLWLEELAYAAPFGLGRERLAQPFLRGVIERGLDLIKLEVELGLIAQLRTGRERV